MGWGQTEPEEKSSNSKPDYFSTLKSGYRLDKIVPPALAAGGAASGAVSPKSNPASRRPRVGSLGRKPRGATKRVREIKDGMESIYNVDLVTGEKTLVRKMR